MTSKVKHGRRVGQIRDPNFDSLSSKGEDHKNIAILQPKDWRRICTNLTRYDHEAEIRKAMLKKQNELHEKSKDIVKHWENTIEGQRLKKLEAKKTREVKDEEEKKKLDRVEAEYQAQKRKEAIKWAKQQLNFQTDRAKNFHSALIMTEVLKEREAQLERKDEQKKWDREREVRYLKHQEIVNEASAFEENQKAHARYERAKEVADFQLSQVNDLYRQRQLDFEENMEEGQRIQKKYLEFAVANDVIANQRKKDKMRLMKSYLTEVELKRIQEQKEKEHDEEANQRLRRFANAKKKMALTRKKKEEEMFDHCQQRTERMCKKMENEMRQKIDDEDECIAKVIQERDAKAVQTEKEKEKKRLECLAAIDQFRNVKWKMQEDDAIKQEAHDQATLQYRFDNDRKYHKRQEEIRNERRSERKKVEDCHKHQIALRVEAFRKEKAAHIAWGQNNVNRLLQEEAEFQQYAKEVIDDSKARGRVVYPLLKAAREGPGGGRGPQFSGCGGLRPSYMASDQTAVQLPHYPRDENTVARDRGQDGKCRLGFTW